METENILHSYPEELKNITSYVWLQHILAFYILIKTQLAFMKTSVVLEPQDCLVYILALR